MKGDPAAIELDHLIVHARDQDAAARRLADVYWNDPEGHQWEMLTVSHARGP